MRRYKFIQLDVFASRPLEGNPLAVFTDARSLGDLEMQALAREMNLSETTFILPRDPGVERERGVLVRIFTPEEELPFAGHPTLGTAAVLRGRGLLRAGRAARTTKTAFASQVWLDLRVGKVPVVFREETGGQVFGEMRQPDPKFGAVHAPEAVARVIGLKAGDIAPDLPIQTVSTGVPFAIVPIASLRSLAALCLDWNRVSEYNARSDAKSFYFVTRRTENPAARLRARGIFSNGEDPGTGSAAGCAAAWMVRYGIARPEETVLIEQGVEIKRPSRIFVRAGREGDQVVNARVGGYVVEVMRGQAFLPGRL